MVDRVYKVQVGVYPLPSEGKALDGIFKNSQKIKWIDAWGDPNRRNALARADAYMQTGFKVYDQKAGVTVLYPPDRIAEIQVS